MSGHTFSLQVEIVAFQKEGLSHIGKMVDNLVSRGKELPGNTYFKTPLERRVNQQTGKEELFWRGYDRSISNSMLRYAAWLKLNGAEKEQVEKAKAEWQMWNQLQDTILNLKAGKAVQFLALRGIDVAQGVALQQISRQDGQLVLESRLLPFNEVHQIERFRQQMSERKDDVSFFTENQDVSPLVGWVVKGEILDFKQELPELINWAGREQPIEAKELIRDFGIVGPVRVENYPVAVWESVSGAETIQLSPAKQNTEIIKTDFKEEEKEKEDRVIVSGFWFEVIRGSLLTTQTLASSIAEEKAGIALKNQVVLPTTEVSFKEEIFESEKEPVVKGATASSVETERTEIVKLPAEVAEQVEQRVVREVAESVVSENQDKSLILRQETLFQEVTIGDQDFESVPTELKNQAVLEPELEQNRVIYQADTVIPFRNGIRNGIKEAGGEMVRIETMPHEELVEEKITVSQVNRDKTVLPIWEIRMQGISLDDIPEWNLSSVLIGEDLGWSMTVPGLKAEEELETNAERAFELGKWGEFDYLKKTVEVVETILLVIVNTNWEQPPRLRRKIIKDFGSDRGSGSVKYRQIQR